MGQPHHLLLASPSAHPGPLLPLGTCFRHTYSVPVPELATTGPAYMEHSVSTWRTPGVGGLHLYLLLPIQNSVPNCLRQLVPCAQGAPPYISA